MKSSRSLFFKGTVFLLLILLVSSCVRVDTGNSAPTIGNEMIDLVKVKELGAITDEEFTD